MRDLCVQSKGCCGQVHVHVTRKLFIANQLERKNAHFYVLFKSSDRLL